ncbi:hypothetical protein [Streptomyces sp. NPDC057838]|uniref:hypothetical protein n=1 Tax=unclassified Streptomyces TaxID=2593676 RepID=UPI0036AF1B7B
MFETIHWRCFARVADRRAAGRVIGRVETLLSHAVELESYERYRKFPELAELGFVSPLRCPTPETALLTTLQRAWTLASPWAVSGSETGASHEFEGIASADVGARFRVAGIEWMEFRVQVQPR